MFAPGMTSTLTAVRSVEYDLVCMVPRALPDTMTSYRATSGPQEAPYLGSIPDLPIFGVHASLHRDTSWKMNQPWKLVAALLPLVALVNAALPHYRGSATSPPRPSVPRVPVPDDILRTDKAGTTLPPLNTTYYFEQLIDHNNPSLGTFQQRYWTTWESYEPGGPIILFTPGEINAEKYTGYLTNSTINGQLAQQENGATVLLEHRYYGLSNPFGDLSVQSLEYHTISQAIADLVYFAENVQLPMPGGNSVSATTTPWVLIGGSYSGALTAWTMATNPGIFKAGYASSAVVQASVDFWSYLEPIRQFMPQNCSADVQAVIAHVDQVYTNGTTAEIQDLLEMFYLQTLQHLDDAAAALRNDLFQWQDIQPYAGPGQAFFQFCDALEVKNGQVAGLSGWGLNTALQQWSTYWYDYGYGDFCGIEAPVYCFGTYDGTLPKYTDTSLDNPTRSWTWITCNEVGWFQDGAPTDEPTLVSRLIQPVYDERQCNLWFPDAFTGTPTPNATGINTLYKGWNLQAENLFFANGQRDPWRDATVSADGITIESTSSQMIGLSDGFHCSDLITANGGADSTILAVQQQGLAALNSWLQGGKTAKRDTIRFAREH
ncbi:hypothetical protein NM688_g1003 [Phlebia brevispora]|uniref:Uncharacterized protein n=1 Tax=Phlebia brevispora TaxID=194682 RepID=A0ACC1TCZ7_9APHY|nr:hypothetical protein NM688_g1003 [Phlebia brevispora]